MGRYQVSQRRAAMTARFHRSSLRYQSQRDPRTTRVEGGGTALKLLRFPAVRERTGLSRSTIWRLERQGAFPRHHRISPNAVAWVEDDVANWIRSKVAGIAV